MKHKLKMIQADIDNGVIGDPCWCPIANMIARELNISDMARKDNINVDTDAIKVKGCYIFSNYLPLKARVPSHIRKFIDDFDDELEVEPNIEMEIELP